MISARFVEGQYHGASDGFVDGEGWPPSPRRLFQALVAASSKGATISSESADALRWFETLDAPEIVSPAVRKGRKRTQFVPNNDLDSEKRGLANFNGVRVEKDWRPYYFDAALPILYLYTWHDAAHIGRARRICRIAQDVCQLGKGIDIAWLNGTVLSKCDADSMLENHPGESRKPIPDGSVNVPTTGTFESLVNRQIGLRHRLRTVVEGRKVNQEFTQPPKAKFKTVGYGIRKDYLYFELRNVRDKLDHRSLSLAAHLVANIRDAGAERLKLHMPNNAKLIDRIVRGVGANASDLQRRIRIIPIPSIGSRFVEPLIRRVVVEIPPDCPIDIEDLRWAFSGIAYPDMKSGDAPPGRLISADANPMFSRYLISESEFSSITPLALPIQVQRGFKMGERITGTQRVERENSVRHALDQALRHAGVFTRLRDARTQREPFVPHGARAEPFAHRTRFPKAFMWHAAIKFDDVVPGPLIVGNGRYLGLGLMKPISSAPQVIAFSIEDGLTPFANDRSIAVAARRAIMSRCQLMIDRNKALPSYVSGHLADGSPSRDTSHQHIAIVADLQRKRILVIAPHLLRRGNLVWEGNVRREQASLYAAIRDMDLLIAGKSGRLQLAPDEIDVETDPVLGFGQIWENITDYEVTRHQKHDDIRQTLMVDLLSELRRCKIASPCDIEVLAARRGKKGRIRGRFRLTFPENVAGPLLFGRSMHKGGGLFATPCAGHV